MIELEVEYHKTIEPNYLFGKIGGKEDFIKWLSSGTIEDCKATRGYLFINSAELGTDIDKYFDWLNEYINKLDCPSSQEAVCKTVHTCSNPVSSSF